MYKSSRTPAMGCEYPVRPNGKEAFPCGSKHADLVRVVYPSGGKGKTTWAWWCDAHRDFFEKYLAPVSK